MSSNVVFRVLGNTQCDGKVAVLSATATTIMIGLETSFLYQSNCTLKEHQFYDNNG